ncbi:hypothetical protein [Myceligenerans pegani]|uniref:Uncharacterized protein n=1 Tax=Myceligenerans pegani TaxID=2776917 RepID=A0ABR9N1F3_9MICO|nr:hypothetical protein [Myceligenerans sp. TRM 65318]MBE1877490.1 hypothetical protein [Myceligenerans sp. TRM 65318]MBE3019761.1 hypothetical protein [Myceligenerans sp. TRM 65318]
MPYTADKPPLPETPEQLRARIPGWGADLDPADRPSYPREVQGLETGAHWDLPEQQEERQPRERSIEHARLTPAFGTSVPLKGLSGVVRSYAYRRFSEGRAAHWLLLIAADRVDAVESHLTSFTTRRPDNPVTETGVLAEASHHPVRSRAGRVDPRHQVLDPVIVVGPWVLAAVVVYRSVRAMVRRART